MTRRSQPADELRARLLEALALKELPREGWRRLGIARPESVAGHSWGVAFLVLCLSPASLDRGRAIALALLHDLAEVRTGDITPHDGVAPEEKHRREVEALSELLSPFARAAELRGLFEEYEAAETPEARFVRSCDKLEMALQAQRYTAETGVDTSEFIDSALAVLEDEELRRLARGR